MARTLQRITPAGRPRDYQTYQVLAPIKSHWRRATCEESGCLAHAHGWRTRVEGLQPADVAAIKASGRRYAVERVAQGESYFVFPAGQACFRASQHRVPLERPGIFVVRQGDYRDRTGPRRQFQRPEDWRDHFAEHQQRLADQRARG